jgi:hypothetical protein
MTILQKLKTVALPTGSNPVLNHRMRLIRRLEEQAKLAADPSYIRVTTSFKGKGAERHQVRREQRVSSWVKDQPDGTCVLVIKVGARPVELSPGKPGVLLESKEKVAETLDLIIQGVRDGEFDVFLGKTKKPGTTKSREQAVKLTAVEAAKQKEKALLAG